MWHSHRYTCSTARAGRFRRESRSCRRPANIPPAVREAAPSSGFARLLEGSPIPLRLRRGGCHPASSFVNPASIGDSSVLNLEQLSELHDRGWTICSHAYRHDSLDELERDAQEARIRDAKEWLTAHGFADGAEYFAYPYSNYDATTLELAAEYHQLGFAAGWPAAGHVSNRLLAPRRGDLEPAAAERLLDLAVRHTGVVTLLFHSMWDFENAGYHVDSFETIVDEVAKRERKGNLDVLSVSEFDSRLVKSTLPAPYI
ncbi:polysaccharide deacetylase family protein [Haloarchaeobius amylolyticus]|uniref:Polysaccharide deacetylase family protein n=1 Tax=Haloarchaeobius amylolyticus TaxID=1198296 RepID=A0ABD6BDQ8_9EURY